MTVITRLTAKVVVVVVVGNGRSCIVRLSQLFILGGYLCCLLFALLMIHRN